MACQKRMNIVGFREKLVNSLLKISCPTVKHYLRETEEREVRKRSDRRRRRFCVGCYHKLKETVGRNLAKRKAK